MNENAYRLRGERGEVQILWRQDQSVAWRQDQSVDPSVRQPGARWPSRRARPRAVPRVPRDCT